MEFRWVEPETVLDQVHSLLADLAPGERLAFARDDGTIVLQREGAIDPEMMARVQAVTERYYNVFERLAQ